MIKVDATYQEVGNKIELYPNGSKAAGWIAKHLTTNVAETIYLEREYGLNLITSMQTDGLKIVRKNPT